MSSPEAPRATGQSLRSQWDDQSEAWLRWARTPDHDHFFWKLGLPAFLEMLPEPGRLTLDIGCGEGRLSRILRDRGHRVIGFDGSATLAHHASHHGEPTAIGVADAAALPVKAQSADLVVSYMVLQDVDDLESAVREAARALGGGGRFCAAFIHPMNSAAVFGNGPPSLPHDYFVPRRLHDVVEREGIRMDFHSEHRPLERYIRAFEDAGLLIETMREPRPDAEMIASSPSFEQFTRVPWALFVRGLRALWATR
ncbi:MAG: class I SAM-dependent methyltransferase [Actinomycetota bacterium]